MKINRIWYIGLVIALLLAIGCSGGSPKPAAKPALDPLDGRYTASGGGGAMPQVNALTKRFTELHPGVIWVTEDVGSDASVTLTAGGDVDIGFTSRDLTGEEKGKVAALPIGVSGTGLAVNAANPVTGLTKGQVAKIFSGEITDWSEVGGEPGKIKVLVRERDSTTRTSFEKYFLGGTPTYANDVVEVYTLQQTLIAIQSFKNAIATVTLNDRTFNQSDLRLLAIDGVTASKENLYSGVYKIRRPLFFVYHPDTTKLKPAVRSFLDFVRGQEGQQILAGL